MSNLPICPYCGEEDSLEEVNRIRVGGSSCRYFVRCHTCEEDYEAMK